MQELLSFIVAPKGALLLLDKDIKTIVTAQNKIYSNGRGWKRIPFDLEVTSINHSFVFLLFIVSGKLYKVTGETHQVILPHLNVKKIIKMVSYSSVAVITSCGKLYTITSRGYLGDAFDCVRHYLPFKALDIKSANYRELIVRGADQIAHITVGLKNELKVFNLRISSIDVATVDYSNPTSILVECLDENRKLVKLVINKAPILNEPTITVSIIEKKLARVFGRCEPPSSRNLYLTVNGDIGFELKGAVQDFNLAFKVIYAKKLEKGYYILLSEKGELYKFYEHTFESSKITLAYSVVQFAMGSFSGGPDSVFCELENGSFCRIVPNTQFQFEEALKIYYSSELLILKR